MLIKLNGCSLKSPKQVLIYHLLTDVVNGLKKYPRCHWVYIRTGAWGVAHTSYRIALSIRKLYRNILLY